MGNVMTTHFLPFSSFHENNHWKSRKGLKMVPKKSRCCPKDLIFAFVVLFWGRSWIPNPVLVLLYSLHSICILPNPVLVLLYSLHSICILPSLHILLSLHSLYIFTVSAVSTVCTVSTLSTVSTVMLTSFTCASSGHFSSIVKFLFQVINLAAITSRVTVVEQQTTACVKVVRIITTCFSRSWRSLLPLF